MNQNRIFLYLSINEKSINALLDSKATRNIIFINYVKGRDVSLVRKTQFYVIKTVILK